MSNSVYDYLNGYGRWLEEDNPTDKAIVLYGAMLYMFNRRGWPRWARVDTQTLMLMARTTDKKTAYRARDALVKDGLLEYRSGKKGKASEYSLLVYGRHSTTESTTERATESATEGATENATPNKTKIKTKKKYPPIAPQAKNAILPKYEPERFEGFYSAYPKKVAKAAAVRAWDKLKPDKELCDCMARALKEQMQSEQWQDRLFIPNPATWLNGRRWLDELEPASGKKTIDPFEAYLEELDNDEERDS